MRILGLEARQSHQLDVLARPAPALGRRHAQLLQAELDVPLDRPPGKQRELLEDHGGGRLSRVSRPLGRLEVHLALGRREEAAHDVEQRRLAAAGGAEQRDELLRGRGEGHPIERAHRLPAAIDEGLTDTVDDDAHLRGTSASGEHLRRPHDVGEFESEACA